MFSPRHKYLEQHQATSGVPREYTGTLVAFYEATVLFQEQQVHRLVAAENPQYYHQPAWLQDEQPPTRRRSSSEAETLHQAAHMMAAHSDWSAVALVLF